MDEEVVDARRRDVVAERLERHAAIARRLLQFVERERLDRGLLLVHGRALTYTRGVSTTGYRVYWDIQSNPTRST
jgi:hypothetical protein